MNEKKLPQDENTKDSSEVVKSFEDFGVLTKHKISDLYIEVQATALAMKERSTNVDSV